MTVITCDFSFLYQKRKFEATTQIFKPADEIMLRVLTKAPKETDREVYIFYLSKKDNNSIYWKGSNEALNSISKAIIKEMAKCIKGKYKTADKLMEAFKA